MMKATLLNCYKVNGKVPPGYDVNKKRSIRRKAEKIILKNGDRSVHDEKKNERNG